VNAPRQNAAAGGTNDAIAFAGLLLVGLIIRLGLMLEPGLTGDLDQFVLWVHGLATAPFGHAYDQDISFGPVMVWIWGGLAWLDPAFRTVTTSADPAVRLVMKSPAVLADLAIAALVWWQLRPMGRWALIAAALVALHPAVVDVSAWWGQYESVYVVFGVIAFVLTVRGHSSWAAAALALAIMTKPQALPFLVPFAAWFLAREGWRGALRAALVGGVVIGLVWLPFIPFGGLGGYARNLAQYQGDIFAILSLRAWNLWWLVQQLMAGGSFVADTSAIAGPITLRHVGYALALLGEIAVFAFVYRARTPRGLALGVAGAVLVAFCLLTSMHERYAFGALAFLPLALPGRRILALAATFGAVITLNLLSAIPPSPAFEAALPINGALGVVGSIAMLAILVATLVLLRREAVAAAPHPAESAVQPEPSTILGRAA